MSDELTEVFGRQEALHPDLVEYQHEIPKLGMCIRHPLVFSVPHCDAMNSFVNLQYLRKKEAVDRARRSGEWMYYLTLHERPYRWEALQSISRSVSAFEFSKLFAWVWTDSENIWQNLDIIHTMLGGRLQPTMMHFNELEKLSTQPDSFQVYRGHRHHNQHGLSWTTDRDVAVWFARRFARRGYVTTGTIKKKHVIALFLGRNESEILCLPQHVENKIRTKV